MPEEEDQSKINRVAWNTKAYDAWVKGYGTPDKLAQELKLNHVHSLRRWLKYIGNPAGKRVINLLGSHGRKGIALAMMGADVTIVDISEENRMYARQVADALNVDVRYKTADVLEIPNEEELGTFEIVLMEFGILHYFSDLNALFSVVRRRLGPAGRFILTDFHPFAHKLLAMENQKVGLRADGDYFCTSLKESDVAYA